jgi:hypothetical protein
MSRHRKGEQDHDSETADQESTAGVRGTERKVNTSTTAGDCTAGGACAVERKPQASLKKAECRMLEAVAVGQNVRQNYL